MQIIANPLLFKRDSNINKSDVKRWNTLGWWLCGGYVFPVVVKLEIMTF